MGGKKGLGIGLLIVGFIAVLNTRFGGEFLVLGLAGIVIGGSILLRGGGFRERIKSILSSMSTPSAVSSRREEGARGIDPLLPVRVLKLAEKRAGKLTVSSVAMTLEVGLDDAQAALDELSRKGAANAEVDMATGIATYSFPEFLREGSGEKA